MLICIVLWPSDVLIAQSQHVTPDGNGDITFVPGLRMQTRYEFNQIDRNNDFFIRRLRLKGKGDIFGIASYNFEVKIDNTGRFNRTPSALLEHAWFTIPIVDELLTVRVGLEDDVFSRNALTSDSKLMVMDRSLIKNQLTLLGVTDNTIGALVYGRPMGGKMTYSFGIFDNLGFETAGDSTILARKSQGAMLTGRFAYDFLDPANPSGSYDDYMASYIGEGQRLTVATSLARLNRAEIGSDDVSLWAWGADLFFNIGPFTFEAEYNKYNIDFLSYLPSASGTIVTGDFPLPQNFNGSESGNAVIGDGWYAQAGILFLPKVEFAVRHQQLDANNHLIDDKNKWTTIGFNIYLRGHTFKIQTDYTFKKEDGDQIENDVLQAQLQLSF